MPPFRFRLTTLLLLRENERDERRSRLAEAQQAEDIVNGRIADLEAEVARLRDAVGQRSRPGRMDVDALMELQRYELLLKAERQAAAQQRELVAAEVERRREALVAADRQVRVLERLRETQQRRHRLAEERQQGKAFDEIAAQSHCRKERSTWDD
jgi:flagellar export protein FliJ